mgnify:CR=1 FL=1
MQSILKRLNYIFDNATLESFPELQDHQNFLTEITPSTQEKFGHYQYNSAMKLSKLLKIPPREIAERIIKNIDTNDLISNVEIAGPGFINITLSKEYLAETVLYILDNLNLGIDLPINPQRIVIDFSSPNIAKELHVGHLRSTIIGDSLARLFEFLGHDVLRLNHIGDWGTSFGMLIAYLKEEEPEVLTGKKNTDLTHLVNWYKASKKRFDEDAEFKKRAQAEVSVLQSGDPDALKAWKIICEISEKAYREIYDLLNVKINDRGESFYNPMLAGVIKDLENKHILEISEGAKCVFLEGFVNREGEPLPMIVQKSDGGFNYATTDMAAMKHRTQIELADRIIILTDAGQSSHFQMIAKAAEKVGYLDPKKVRFDHVTFGLVLSPDGTKFKTRSGDTEKLIDLLNTAVNKAEEILNERSLEIDEKEKKHLAKALGISAIKYADLSSNRIGDYTFSYDRMLRFEGNTAAYLMYSYVRIEGIKRRINQDIESLIKDTEIALNHPSEISLGLHLARFQEVLDQIVEDLMPHRLTDYLYNLAEKFNAFFRDCRVEGAIEQNSRLLLCEAVSRTMKQGLDILGVETVKRM